MQIEIRDLAQSEYPAAQALWSNASSLRSYLDEFASAVALFSQAPTLSPGQALHWQILAAQQAILSVYNCSMALKGVRTQARQIESLAWALSAIENSRETMKVRFPNLGELRQTVMHKAEKHWDEERDRENSVRGPSVQDCATFTGTFGMSSSLVNGSYVATFSGKSVWFDMTSNKVAELRTLLDDLEAALSQPRENPVGDGE